jgi:uncharacterized membrane protein YozB (DUF420 family)
LDLRLFPTINAGLNATSALLLGLGLFWIRRGRRTAHIACMVAALATSALFLACYLYYHAHVGATRFQGTGWIRPVYFSILLSHTVLAVAVLPLILTAVVRALRGQFDRHARVARWAWPVWMYVSVTGVVIYVMLYHLWA